MLKRNISFPWMMIGILVAACTGCASSPDRIILLPNVDGSPSALIVKTATGERVIDKPYDVVNVSQKGGMTSGKESPESVNARYAAVLAAQPMRPKSYIVYFVSGKDEITSASQEVVKEMKADVRARSAPEIVVIGHTDRVGSLEANDALSVQRAKVMRDILVAGGIPSASIDVAGRGEREPLIPTADEVPESKNRRVEINVR